MPDPVLSFVLAAHAAAVLLGMLAARQKGRRLSVPYACFMLALPVFGAVVCWVFALASPPRDGIRDPMMRNTQRHEAWVGIRHEADRLVPLEEAFLINEPKKRRELMMDLLRSEPRKHLDLLLLARFNEDPETAHYATATLTEVQRQMQLELQQMQTALLKNPQDAKTRLAYIELLNGYVNSGLLEGQLLERQRRMLGKALDELPEDWLSVPLCSIQVRNDLALGRAQEARLQALDMITRWPEDERAYLEMLEVCVQTRDRYALQKLKERLKHAPVEWTRAGLERIHYFCGKGGEGNP